MKHQKYLKQINKFPALIEVLLGPKIPLREIELYNSILEKFNTNIKWTGFSNGEGSKGYQATIEALLEPNIHSANELSKLLNDKKIFNLGNEIKQRQEGWNHYDFEYGTIRIHEEPGVKIYGMSLINLKNSKCKEDHQYMDRAKIYFKNK
ncbi:MAG: hypothetical protein ACOC1P_06475 [Minisyncoccales bacterium]